MDPFVLSVNTQEASLLRKYAGKINDRPWRGYRRHGVQAIMRAQMLFTTDGKTQIASDDWLVEIRLIEIRSTQMCIVYRIPYIDRDETIPERRKGQWNYVPLELHPSCDLNELDPWINHRSCLETYPDPYVPRLVRKDR